MCVLAEKEIAKGSILYSNFSWVKISCTFRGKSFLSKKKEKKRNRDCKLALNGGRVRAYKSFEELLPAKSKI